MVSSTVVGEFNRDRYFCLERWGTWSQTSTGVQVGGVHSSRQVLVSSVVGDIARDSPGA